MSRTAHVQAGDDMNDFFHVVVRWIWDQRGFRAQIKSEGPIIILFMEATKTMRAKTSIMDLRVLVRP